MALPITKLNAQLEGVFTYKGKDESAPFTLPGDLVQFAIRRKGGKLRMEILRVEHLPVGSEPHEGMKNIRLSEPFCTYFARCGGCRGQHLAYDTQMNLKCNPVLQKMQEFTDTVIKVHNAPLLKEYRNRMDFTIDGNIVGLRPVKESSNFIDIDCCPIIQESSALMLSMVRQTLSEHPTVGFRRRDKTGSLKYATIREGAKSGVVVLTLCAESRSKDYFAFRNRLIERIEEHNRDRKLFSLVECEVPMLSDLSCVSGGETILGESFFEEELASILFRVPYDSFFQPNPSAFDTVIQKSIEMIARHLPKHDGSQHSYLLGDLFCGAGVLSSIIVHNFPDYFNHVYGWELVSSGPEHAYENFPSKLSDSLHFSDTDLNRPPDNLFHKEGEWLLLLVDPPRSGISESLCRKIANEKPSPLLLYVSCNPHSQMRDLALLTESYEVVEGHIVDCYPQTPHLEQVLLLKRKVSP